MTTTEWVVANSHNKISPAKAQRIVNAAISAGNRHGVDPVLILAVMRTESGYRADVTSVEGAKCLMQVIPKWHPEKIAGRNLLSIPVCADVGAQVIKEYLGMNGTMRKALAKYSGGAKGYANKVFAWQARILMETRDAPMMTVRVAGH